MCVNSLSCVESKKSVIGRERSVGKGKEMCISRSHEMLGGKHREPYVMGQQRLGGLIKVLNFSS